MGFNEANPSKEKRKEKTKKIYKKAKAICQWNPSNCKEIFVWEMMLGEIFPATKPFIECRQWRKKHLILNVILILYISWEWFHEAVMIPTLYIAHKVYFSLDGYCPMHALNQFNRWIKWLHHEIESTPILRTIRKLINSLLLPAQNF